MHIIHRQRCRVCGNSALVPVIDLGEQHLQGSFIKPGYTPPPMRKLPTKLVRCDTTKDEQACGLLQLAHTFPPEILYANYWYRSGTNATMRNHLKGIVDAAITVLARAPRRVLDIGCNDGTLLSNYDDAIEKFGVDPSDIASEVPAPVTVINTVFPSPATVSAFEDGKFDVITSIAMFYDLEDPVSFAREIKRILVKNGVWILEMSYLPLMLKQNSYDTICHEHLEYYSLATLDYIFAKAGLRVFKASLNDINGGSIRCFVTHADNRSMDSAEAARFLNLLRINEFELELDADRPYLAFQQRIEEQRRELQALLDGVRMQGKRVHVYGASTKGNVLLQWCGIDSSTVECAADRNPAKAGARTLGTNIPIVDEATSRAGRPDYYLVLPWHFKAEFLDRERATIESGTKMIFPLPTLSIVDADNLAEERHRAEEDSKALLDVVAPPYKGAPVGVSD
ncbi:class I SAM-dependent methyltransferase [Azospirillum sp. ST 5-10]|uniref:class I SAM-dependent methyltransferase n=1 Tax=unclassified Azospirillum TaxID=2630922 RepID=UPI003F49F431